MNDIQNADLAVDSKLVDAHLERIFASPEFVRSERMISFLRFLVERTLSDKKTTINERTIGRSVFNRPTDWDPSVDTIVRSESRRLRSKLNQYYEGLGRKDQLRIQIPKGTYVPEFVSQIPDSLPLEEPRAAQTEARATQPSGTEYITQGVAERRLSLFWLIGFGIAACLLLLAVRLERSRVATKDRHADFSTVSFTMDFGKEYSPTISPDGHTVAYVWDDGGGNPNIFLRDVDSKQSRPISSSPDVRLYPSWSHDGTRIAFLAGRGNRLAVVVHVLKTGSESTVMWIEKSVGRGVKTAVRCWVAPDQCGRRMTVP